MRKCPRCDTVMTENLILRDPLGPGNDPYIADGRGFGSKNLGSVSAALCPECGELSFYIKKNEHS